MITHLQIGSDEDLAREILVMASSIAPCIQSFADDGEDQKNALAILKRVYAEVSAIAKGGWSRFVKAQRTGASSVEYTTLSSAFEGQPTIALRSMCGASTPQALPRGTFPKPARVISHLWPEDYS